MKSKQEKTREVEALHELFQVTPTIFVTGFEHLTVEQDFELRKSVREAGGRYRVIKNTLVANASKGTPSETVFQGLTGMTSMACTSDDPVALAKALTTYAKQHPTLTFKAGVVEGRAVDAGQIQQLAAMPSKDELFAKLLFLVNAPATYLARAIGGVGRNLAVVIDQGCKESKFTS